MNIVKGNIVGQGPIKSGPALTGFDIVYVTPGMLPMPCSVDMDSLKSNWVKVVSRQFKSSSDGLMYDGWCELPRFKADVVEPPTPEPVSKKWVFKVTVEQIEE